MGRLDRRALFTSGAAAALLAASGLALNASPQPGGHLRIALPRDGSLLQITNGAVLDNLSEIAPDGSLRGELATHWQSNASADRWQFHLEPNARFHDGSQVTTADVIARLEQVGLPGLDHMEALSDTGFDVRLDAPKPDLPILLARPEFGIAKPAQGAELMENGTGLYRVDRFDGNRDLLASKVSDHYRSGRAGWADRVEAVVIPDPAIRAEALRDGFVDLAYLPEKGGLVDQGDFAYHPSLDDLVIAASRDVGIPGQVGDQAPLDNGRLSERWWMR